MTTSFPVKHSVRVVTSKESAARDASAIASGIPSRALMQRAGAAAAGELAIRVSQNLDGGVLVLAGPGNNGGDAWVVARALAVAGARVRVVEPIEAKTDDARAERALALEVLGANAVESFTSVETFDRGEAIVVDGLLGTGASRPPRGEVADVLSAALRMKMRGAYIAALDLPSGVDATSGLSGGACVFADLTLTFGTIKRGHLLERDACGTIVVLDIGLGAHAALDDGAPLLVDERWVGARVPTIVAKAHKGARKKLVIVGGAAGMAGATILAARAALRSGIGMVKLVVAPASMSSVQEAEPHALAAPWPGDDAAVDSTICEWADAIVIGPGLGNTPESRALVERLLTTYSGPALIDADALNVFAGDVPGLARLLAGRPALITPHPAELARLIGTSVDAVLADRFNIGARVAQTLDATVLLKGVPTIISAPPTRPPAHPPTSLVSASGTPVLATAGSGDLLCGIAGTLLAQTGDALVAGAAGAWVHGHAAEVASTSVRGATLDDVAVSLRDSWRLSSAPTRYPVLAELPAVGDRA